MIKTIQRYSSNLKVRSLAMVGLFVFVGFFVQTVYGAGSTPTATLTPTSSFIPAGQSVTLNWSSVNSVSCTASGSWSGTLSTDGSQSTGTLNTPGQYYYDLFCTNSTGDESAPVQAIVNVSPGAAPTVTLSASPTLVTVPVETTLTWTVTNATSCTASNDYTGGWSGSKNPNGGSQTLGLWVNNTYDFVITCSNGSGNASAGVRVTTGDGGLYDTCTPSFNPGPAASGYQWVTTAQNCQYLGGYYGSNDYCNWSAATCDAGSVGQIGEYTDQFGPDGDKIQCQTSYVCTQIQPATINVIAQGCSVAGTWTLNPGGYTGSSNSVPPGTYSLTVMNPPYPNGATGYAVSSSDGGNSLVVASGQTKQFTITWNGCVPPPTAPVVTLTPNPTTGIAGTINPTLTWTTTNNPSLCTAGLDWSGNKTPTSGGSQLMGVINIPGIYNYSLTCSNTGGSGFASTSITVTAATPSGLTATPAACGVGTINVSWGASTGATSYTLRDGATVIYTGPATSYSHTGLALGSSHSYTVLATASSGSSGYSSAVVASAPSACPAGGTIDIKGSTNGTTYSDGPITVQQGESFWFQWTSGNVSSCNLTSPSSTSLLTNGTQGPFNSTHPWYPTTGGTSYTIVCNATAGGTVTNTVVATLAPVGPPPAPSIIASTSATCASVDISWSGYNLALSTGFKVYRSGVLIATIGDTTSYTDPNLAPGTYSYTVKAVNASGDSVSSNSSSATASAQCTTPPPVVTLSASPTTTSNGDSTLTWTATNSPTSCTATNNKSNSRWNGGKSTAGGSQLITNITTTTIFSLSCANLGGTSNVATVTVTYSKPGGPPVVTLTASPNPVNEGDSSVLTWSVTNSPTSCTASGGHPQWTGSITPTTGGTRTITNISVADVNLFRLQCTNGQNSNLASVTIDVTSDPVGPVVKLTANPTTVTSGGSTVLTWDPVLNAQSCNPNSTPFNSAWYNPNVKNTAGGSQTIPNLTQTTSFVLICTSASGGQGQSSATVTVTPATATITVNQVGATGGSWLISPGSYATTPNTVAPGTYSIGSIVPPSGYSVSSVTSTDGGNSLNVTAGATKSFTINYSVAPSFNYSLSATNVSVQQGSAGNSTVTKTYLSGTTEPVTISVNPPPGVSVAYSGQPCALTCDGGITFTVGGGVTPGPYNLIVVGTSQVTGIVKNTPVTLTVTAAANLNVDVSSNPSSTAQVGQPVQWTCTATGGSGVYTYTWSGSGVPTSPPITPSFTSTYSTVGSKEVVCNVNDGTQSASSLPRAIQISVNPIFIEF